MLPRDVQVFSRTLTDEEAVGFTNCNDKVTGGFDIKKCQEILKLMAEMQKVADMTDISL